MLPAVSLNAQARYLQALAEGRSHTQAARLSGATPQALSRLLSLDPSFSAEARAAEAAAADQVEETVFRLATGAKTPARQDYERERCEAALQAEQDPPDFPPNEPSLAAAKFYLEHRSPERWAPTPEHSTHILLSTAHLLTPEGVSDFQATLQARRNALTTTATECKDPDAEAPGS